MESAFLQRMGRQTAAIPRPGGFTIRKERVVTESRKAKRGRTAHEQKHERSFRQNAQDLSVPEQKVHIRTVTDGTKGPKGSTLEREDH